MAVYLVVPWVVAKVAEWVEKWAVWMAAPKVVMSVDEKVGMTAVDWGQW